MTITLIQLIAGALLSAGIGGMLMVIYQYRENRIVNHYILNISLPLIYIPFSYLIVALTLPSTYLKYQFHIIFVFLICFTLLQAHYLIRFVLLRKKINDLFEEIKAKDISIENFKNDSKIQLTTMIKEKDSLLQSLDGCRHIHDFHDQIKNIGIDHIFMNFYDDTFITHVKSQIYSAQNITILCNDPLAFFRQTKVKLPDIIRSACQELKHIYIGYAGNKILSHDICNSDKVTTCHIEGRLFSELFFVMLIEPLAKVLTKTVLSTPKERFS